jgi:hypothetical protein
MPVMKEERRLVVSEIRVLRRIIRHKREKSDEENCVMCSFIICDLNLGECEAEACRTLGGDGKCNRKP